MYKLILITILANGEITALDRGQFLTIDRCFEGRENILVEHRAWDGYLEAGTQAICVAVPVDTTDNYTEIQPSDDSLPPPTVVPFDSLPEEPDTFLVK